MHQASMRSSSAFLIFHEVAVAEKSRVQWRDPARISLGQAKKKAKAKLEKIVTGSIQNV